MVEQETLRKAQLKMLDILVEIDRICTKHDIQYWLNYGTLLGAVRHQGFIPWDDDCDICMMREDYEKFIEIASKELPNNLFLQNNKTDPAYFKSMTKIRMNGTKLVEFDESENEKYHQGIFVDIFIWDYHHPVIISIMKKIAVINEWKYKRKQYPKGSMKRFAIQIAVAIPYMMYSIINKCLCCMSVYTRKNKSLNWIGQETKRCNMKFYETKNIFPVRKDVVFEDRCFSGPNDYDLVLRKEYGDYMTIPKPENRVWHSKKIEV